MIGRRDRVYSGEKHVVNCFILKHCYFHFLSDGKRHETVFLDGTLCKSVTKYLPLVSAVRGSKTLCRREE